jgi:hypothetical protein
MKRRGALAAVLFIGVFGCNKIVKDTNDKSPPQVEIKVRGADGQYADASSVKLDVRGTGQLDWMCIVSDANGVKSVSISYGGSLDGCTIGSAVWDCVAGYQPHPQNLFQKIDPDPQGKVLDKLPLLATVNGPLSCTCPGQQGTGAPIGRSLKAICTGANWSSDPTKSTTTKTLTIEL